MGFYREYFSSLKDGAVWITGAMLKGLGDLLDADRAKLSPSSGTEIQNGDGRTFLIDPGTAAGAAPPDWQILLQSPNTDNGNVWQRGVRFGSRLYLDEGDQDDTEGDAQTITGLLTVAKPTPADAGWATTGNNDRIWLQIPISTDPTSGAITATTTFTIASDHASGNWGGGPFEYTGVTVGSSIVPQQSMLRKLLGTVVTNPAVAGSFIVKRNVYAPLVLKGLVLYASDSGGSNQALIPGLTAAPLG